MRAVAHLCHGPFVLRRGKGTRKGGTNEQEFQIAGDFRRGVRVRAGVRAGRLRAAGVELGGERLERQCQRGECIGQHLERQQLGKRIGFGTPKEIQENPAVIETYLGGGLDV